MQKIILYNKDAVLAAFNDSFSEYRSQTLAVIVTYAAITQGFNPTTNCSWRLHEKIHAQTERFLNWYCFVHDAESTLSDTDEATMKFFEANEKDFPLCHTDGFMPMGQVVAGARRLFRILSQSALAVSNVHVEFLEKDFGQLNTQFTPKQRTEAIRDQRRIAHFEEVTSLWIYHSVLNSIYGSVADSDELMAIARRYFQLESQLSIVSTQTNIKKVVDLFILGNPLPFVREAFALLCYCDEFHVACVYFLRSLIPHELYNELERIVHDAPLNISADTEVTRIKIARCFSVIVTKDTYPNGLPSAFGSIASKSDPLHKRLYDSEEDVDTDGMQ